jgi:hypothetical protein
MEHSCVVGLHVRRVRAGFRKRAVCNATCRTMTYHASVAQGATNWDICSCSDLLEVSEAVDFTGKPHAEDVWGWLGARMRVTERAGRRLNIDALRSRLAGS